VFEKDSVVDFMSSLEGNPSEKMLLGKIEAAWKGWQKAPKSPWAFFPWKADLS